MRHEALASSSALTNSFLPLSGLAGTGNGRVWDTWARNLATKAHPVFAPQDELLGFAPRTFEGRSKLVTAQLNYSVRKHLGMAGVLDRDCALCNLPAF